MAWTDKYVSAAGGGAHDGSSEANAWTLAECIAAPYAAGQRINIKAGTHANTTTGRTFSVAGTATAPIWWRGYKTTIGDLDDGITVARSLQDGVNLPLVTFTTGQIVVSGANHIFSNIDITSACVTAGGAVSITGAACKLVRCRIENTAANVAARGITTGTAGGQAFINCRIKTTTSSKPILLGLGANIFGCVIIGGDVGIDAGGRTAIVNNVISGFATSGIQTAAGIDVDILYNTIYAAATNGVLFSGAAAANTKFIVANNIIGGCTNGINNSLGTNQNYFAFFRNHFYACTNNLVGITEMAAVGDDLGILLGMFDDDTDPFVAKASGDFSLASGAIDRAAGFPGVFEGQTAMVGYPDIGAVSHAENAAADYPSEDDVRNGVDFNSAANTGNLVLPTEAQVETGVGFGTSGTELTGTLAAGGGRPEFRNSNL